MAVDLTSVRLTPAEIKAEQERRRFNKRESYFPETGPLRRELYVPHMEFLKATASFREICLMASNRSGKALRNDMPVLTPNGWRNIGILKVGDEIIGGDGNPCYVTGVFPQGEKETVEIIFDDGASVVCCYEHLWKCRQGSERYKDKKWRVRSTKEILDKGAATGDPQKVAEIPVVTSYMVKKDLIVDPYVLGVLLGDGSLSNGRNQPSLTSGDPEIAGYVSEHYPVKKGGGHGKYEYTLSGGAVTDLKNIGVWGHRSWEKKIPSEYLWTSAPDRLSILRGLMDTDGTAAKGGAAIFYSTSSALISDVVFLARSLGGKAKVSPKQTYFYHKGVKAAGRPSWAVRLSMPVCPFRLARKALLWKKLSARGLERRVQTAVPKGRAECTCITVSSPDHTFITKDFIVTHNSETVCFAANVFSTGDYPKWWEGKVFKKPVNILVAGETGKLVRDSIQMKLMGPPGAIGSGMIPREKIIDWRPKAGIPDAIDTVRIKHSSGGESIIQFQSYDQGRESFQATERDVIIEDEEPPISIHSECLIRTMTTNGIVMLAFTPLKGITETVLSFQKKAEQGRACIVSCTWDQAPHLSEKDKEELMASLPPHQRDARSKGIPQLGSGAVFPIQEADIVCEPFDIPKHYSRGYGLDVGWNFTACMWGAYDSDADIIYLTHEYKRSQAEPVVHASAIKARGEWIPGVVDPASRGRSQADGTQLMQLYIDQGLKLSPANNAVEAGLFEMYERMTTGRLKVFKTCTEWLAEYRLYRRDEKGKIVKENDHAIDASRYLVMTKIWTPGYYEDKIVNAQVNRGAHVANYNPLGREHLAADAKNMYNPLKR